METNLPNLEYKGYKCILEYDSETNTYSGKICPPSNPTEPLENWEFHCCHQQKLQKIFEMQVTKIIPWESFQKKNKEWLSVTDYESIRTVFNILPDEFRKRVENNEFDKTLLQSVKGGDYEVPLYYVTKAYDVLFKGPLETIAYKIGLDEDDDCTEEEFNSYIEDKGITRNGIEACIDNNKMKTLWKELFNIDIDAIDIDFRQFNMHLPPNFEREFSIYYFNDGVNGVEDWIYFGITNPESEGVTFDQVSCLMELLALICLERDCDFMYF
ncbi:MAG: hypothetical protein J6U84_02530 [Bacteroidales bacterium]|nr:hypothetical protein [Bacteroidales bacterium]